MKLFAFYCILFFASDTFAGCFPGSKTSEDGDSDRADDAVPKSVPKMDKQKLKSKMSLSSSVRQNANMPSEIEKIEPSTREIVQRKPTLNTELLKDFGYNPRKLLLELTERKKPESGSMDSIWQDQDKVSLAHFMSATQSQTLDAYNGETHKLDLSDLKGSKILDEMPPVPEERGASSSRGKALKCHSFSLPPSLANFNPFKGSPSSKSKLSKSLSASLNASSSSSLSGPLKTPKHKEMLKKNGKSNNVPKSGVKSNELPKRNGKSNEFPKSRGKSKRIVEK